MQQTLAGLFLENLFLLGNRVDKDVLPALPARQALIKRRVMLVAAPRKFFNQRFMTFVESFSFPDPAQSFGMMGIAALAVVLGQDIPQAMQLAVLGQQVLTAEMSRMNVPDTHNFIFA
jgi:hypothetical protein